MASWASNQKKLKGCVVRWLIRARRTAAHRQDLPTALASRSAHQLDWTPRRSILCCRPLLPLVVAGLVMEDGYPLKPSRLHTEEGGGPAYSVQPLQHPPEQVTL